METQRTQNSRNNSEKEQGWKTHMYKFQILIYTTAGIKIKYAYISIDMQINTIKSLKMNV